MASTKLGKQLARAAAAGLLAAACGGANSNAAPSRQAEGASPANEPGASESEPNGMMQDELAAEAKDCCKGMNECKGQGGCGMAGSHACKGMNECKGQGGCNAHCPK